MDLRDRARGGVPGADRRATRCGTDASRDAGVYRNRPAGYRLLHPACNAWEHDASDPTTFDTPEELAVAMADARCRWAVACGDAQSSACDPIRVQSYVELHQPVDVVLARTCLDALATAACDADARYAAELRCAALNRGAAPQGSACSADHFCRSGRCDGASATCGGTCAPEAACPSDCPVGECVRGERVAQTYAGLGETCAPAGSLSLAPQCGPHLVCPDAATCVPAPTAGEPCLVVGGSGFPTPYCDTGLECDGTSCIAPVVVDDGHACDRFQICRAGSDCFEGACVRQPPRGAPCRSDRFCAAGSGCNADGTCAAIVGPGCACDDGSACPFSFRCIEGSCQRVGIATQACTDSVRDCDGTPCVDGYCHLRTLGRGCSLDLACDEGHCRPHGLGTCTATVPSGGACFDDPYGCGSGEVCVDFTTVCALPADQRNPCVPGYP